MINNSQDKLQKKGNILSVSLKFHNFNSENDKMTVKTNYPKKNKFYQFPSNLMN